MNRGRDEQRRRDEQRHAVHQAANPQVLKQQDSLGIHTQPWYIQKAAGNRTCVPHILAQVYSMLATTCCVCTYTQCSATLCMRDQLTLQKRMIWCGDHDQAHIGHPESASTPVGWPTAPKAQSPWVGQQHLKPNPRDHMGFAVHLWVSQGPKAAS